MDIFVKVKPASYEEKVEKIDDSHFVVSVKELPVKGQANWGVIRVLAEYFGVSQLKVRIISGQFSHQKMIRIDNETSGYKDVVKRVGVPRSWKAAGNIAHKKYK